MSTARCHQFRVSGFRAHSGGLVVLGLGVLGFRGLRVLGLGFRVYSVFKASAADAVSYLPRCRQRHLTHMALNPEPEIVSTTVHKLHTGVVKFICKVCSNSIPPSFSGFLIHHDTLQPKTLSPKFFEKGRIFGVHI